MRASRRKPLQLQTISPMTRTTSTMGLRAGLFSLAELRAAVPFVDGLMREVDGLHPGLEAPRAIHELTRRLITCFIEDAIGESSRRIAELNVMSPEAVAAAGRTLVGQTAAIETADRDIKAFLVARMYRHPEVKKVREQADAIVRRLFKAYMADASAHAAGMGGQGRGGRSRAGRRRLYRRHDRSFRDRRARAAF